MTTLSLRKRQREVNAFYDRAACWIVGMGCVAITIAWANLLVKVLL